MEEHHCRVCGLYIEELPWGVDGGSPSYEICHCCGVESGYQDYTVESARLYREKWISEGCKWFSPREMPKDWDFKEQLQNVPEGYV